VNINLINLTRLGFEPDYPFHFVLSSKLFSPLKPVPYQELEIQRMQPWALAKLFWAKLVRFGQILLNLGKIKGKFGKN